ncbi:uncharacterized protein [Arachis hypogaea]|uniref:uncharacterized protein isoform X3 n=1 Tax=Arachis hypogaea TaxID=3818 RepID=UPI000A2C3255|nr:uncharacterized protein LOC112794334 isoform X2 [Arachis hypogaea]
MACVCDRVQRFVHGVCVSVSCLCRLPSALGPCALLLSEVFSTVSPAQASSFRRGEGPRLESLCRTLPNLRPRLCSISLQSKFLHILTVVLEVMDDSDSSIKELALSMLVEMLKNQKDAMKSSVEIVIEKLLNVTKDRVLKVWNACKPSVDDTEQPNHEIDVLSGMKMM